MAGGSGHTRWEHRTNPELLSGSTLETVNKSVQHVESNNAAPLFLRAAREPDASAPGKLKTPRFCWLCS